jgi:chromosome segregation ATPase
MSVPRKSLPPTSAAPTAVENDLETTAELPVLDVAAYEAAAAAEGRTNNTDTWIVPSPALSEPPPSKPAGPAPSASVVASAVAAAATPVAAASPAVADDKLTSLEVNLHALSDNLREVEERLRNKGARLTEIEQALGHANAARSVAEQHAKQLTAELTQARAAVTAAEARSAELQRGVDERDATNQTLKAHDKEFEEQLALRDKALGLVQRDLTASQELAKSYLESLQSAEGRRGIFQNWYAELYWEVDERDARLKQLDGQLSTANARTRELESNLSDRIALIAKLEKEVSGLGSKLSHGEATLRDTTRTGNDLKRNVDSLNEILAARDERIKTLEEAATQQTALLAQRQAELDRAVAERGTLISSVNSLESKLAQATTRGNDLDSAARAAQTRCDELEAANNVQRKRVEQIETELAAVRGELQQRSAALQEGSTERSELMARIAAGDARIKELEGRIEEQKEFVRVLQADSNASVARTKELESDLRAAEDMINRLEAEVRGRSTRLEELEKTTQEWRATVEEARSALTDRDSLIRRLEQETANSAVLLGAIQQRLDATGTHEVAPEGDKRLLIRTEGDSDVVHVLGRKTSVGRTPDNDLQIDAKFISRHHAVILAGPAHTIIEDLNSTNGVLVNGRRITRQTLKDGDSVIIGKTVFRFAVRPLGERRS